MHLTLHLTQNCNMRCKYCYSPPHSSPPMSLEIGEKALRLGALRNAGSCGVVFFGGEPLLHKDLITSLVGYGRHLQQRQEAVFHYKITTNGLLLDHDFLEFANQQDIIIAMSFDGIRSAHDAHRQLPDGKGTFELLLSRLQLLLEAKPYASIIMVVNPDTVVSMTDSVIFLLDQGVRYLIVTLNYDSPWDDESLEILEKQYHKLAKHYIKWTQMGKKFYLSPFEVKISSHINYHKADTLRCDCGTRQLSVDPEGYLYPCVQFAAAGPQSPWCIGNVSDGIDSTALQRICSYKQKLNHTCQDCAIEKRCLHTCACLNWQTTGSLTEVSPVLCQHERILTPIADQLAETLYHKRDVNFIQKHYNDAYPILSLLEDHLSIA